METYKAVKEKLCKEFDVIGHKIEAGNDISDNELVRLERITHTLKSMLPLGEMAGGAEHDGMSGRMNYSYHDGGMGGNSFADGYSRGFYDARNMYPDNRGMGGYPYANRNWMER